MEKVEILFQIFIAFTLAKILGQSFRLFKQPAVVGELLAGAILGPFVLGILQHTEFLEVLSELGVIVLLFLVGLETKLEDLTEVGPQAIYVGILGIILPFGFGLGGAYLLNYNTLESFFIASTLVATSVGITIKILSDLGYVNRKSAKIILGAAVLDDILGLMLLAVVRSMAAGAINWVEISILAVEAFVFVGFLLFFGPKFIRRPVKRLKGIFSPPLRFEFALIFCLGLSLLAEYIGLAAIIGAFMAGLVLSEIEQFQELTDHFEPVGWFLVPFFFISMGTFVDLRSFTNISTLTIILFLSVIAFLSKGLGGYLGSLKEGRRIGMEVAVGMIPRGEVGIVAAGIGLAANAIDIDVYTIVVGVVIVTTFLTPPLIAKVYSRKPAETLKS